MKDFRPVWSCVRPIVCHKSNTPFYAQCSTSKLGYCTWCKNLRRGNQKQGSICISCGERLTAKYHRWFPELVRLEPLEKTRNKELYRRYKPLLEKFSITWQDDKGLDFVVNHYMLLKIWVSDEKFDIRSLHLERIYMIGVFAGREFNTGALARKLLRDGCKLVMFRADFPEYFEYLRDQRAAVAEQLNTLFFEGQKPCYFHAHHTNIEGWYDPSYISRETIVDKFKDLCNQVVQQMVRPGVGMSDSSPRRSHGLGKMKSNESFGSSGGEGVSGGNNINGNGNGNNGNGNGNNNSSNRRHNNDMPLELTGLQSSKKT
ncbi:putative exported protein of unknown function [Reticulomyxa filosa]|uniref:Uncharacterized protein n=1 Tax=Reticulomyxa filosa TaxID=46433 RepID=X6P0F1_RETFI|nr:putative exported protein of unknown function [Reticulomyxa filosa]|eukprot:ETO31002.1 putative exported protein of unknown function [Reticulomyxa filosa]